ncbi:hypothetical protein LOK46_13465 [Methylobacterium sp. NMS14P]|uniref:phage tail fiber protein n=1 Tax=Methylobacterium sp. NMS14P TaxID=2894310 RepID=UPI002358970D|nr:hypothetical protein [Methylobacterium sp. NMS14P]WCS27783.1 hypothetical protein LOK46_13465 [Methylobacterium sp. NMS14P]
MPGAMTDYLEKKLLDHTLGKAAFTMPAGVFLGLLTADPTDTGSATSEIPTTGGTQYARQAITATMTAADPTAGSSSNSGAITFPVAGADWGNIAYFGIFDAATGGNMLLKAQTTTTRQILAGDQYVVSAGQLSAAFD